MKKTALIPLLSLILTFVLSTSGNTKLPGKKAFAYEWQNYTKQLLMELAPEDQLLVEKIEIAILPNKEPGAYGDAEEYKITLTRGLINLTTNEGEFAFVVTHEFAHIKLNHPHIDTIEHRPDFFELRQKQELDADRFAQKTVASNGYSPCSGFNWMRKITIYYKTLQSQKGYVPISEERLHLAKTYCRPK